ncbi:MAG: tRNA (adenosine(37)-N6)-dimethylallyltransferase MiaA [Flavobacteriales bacterium]|nr:tRNA (adenosine(37)-N6)-dimethylallyltransferase MiaA [Flavobacteriales bacterium]
MSRPLLICICGPTASGKTITAIEVAEALHTEIISADSRQLYTELRIGTAVPSSEELARVSHHFIQDRSIHASFTAGAFERETLQLLESLFKTHDAVVLCGGTGLFLKALITGLDAPPLSNEHLRKELQETYDREGIEALQARFDLLGPESVNVDRNNPRRLMRAIEIREALKSAPVTQPKVDRFFDVRGFVLNWPREVLYGRINQRVDQMVLDGLEQEAREVYPFRELNALQTVGYREWFEHFNGKLDREEAIEKIKLNTRRYAKRQLTWFRNQTDFEWIEAPHAERIINLLRS